MRRFSLLIATVLLLSGCAVEPSAQPARPIDIAKRAHPGVTNADTWMQFNIRLASGEPTGGAPFAVLSSLEQDTPGQTVYTVAYMTPRGPDRRENVYTWDVENRTVTWTRTHHNGPATFGPTFSIVTGVTSETLARVAAGEASPPVFPPMRTP